MRFTINRKGYRNRKYRARTIPRSVFDVCLILSLSLNYGVIIWPQPGRKVSTAGAVGAEASSPFLDLISFLERSPSREVPGMEKVKKAESRIASVSAFHEEGIHDAFDDGCSICLEPFSLAEPSTVTICRHEFHLQCILEWCERSSNCPMCWQAISLKDPTSQELLAAVERERWFRSNPSRNSLIHHHPTLNDFQSAAVRRSQDSARSHASNRSYSIESSSSSSTDRGEPRNYQSFNSMSNKYKESTSGNTRGWREKLFGSSSSMADIFSEVAAEINAGLGRMLDRLEAMDNSRDSH